MCMWVPMSVCMYVCIYVCICMYMYVRAYVCGSTTMDLHMCIYVHMCVYGFMNMRMYVSVSMLMGNTVAWKSHHMALNNRTSKDRLRTEEVGPYQQWWFHKLERKETGKDLIRCPQERRRLFSLASLMEASHGNKPLFCFCCCCSCVQPLRHRHSILQLWWKT